MQVSQDDIKDIGRGDRFAWQQITRPGQDDRAILRTRGQDSVRTLDVGCVQGNNLEE